MPELIRKIKMKKKEKKIKIEIFGSGNESRSYIYILDAVNAIIRVVNKGIDNQIYNIDSTVAIVEFELSGTTPDTVPPTITSVSLNTDSIPESGGTLTVQVEGFDEYSGFDDSG